MVEARFNGQLIAASDATIVLEGNHYFPPEAVRWDQLQPTWMKSLCLWKGVASYYLVEVSGHRAPHAGWTYRHPSPFARRIKGYVAFWNGVEVHEIDA